MRCYDYDGDYDGDREDARYERGDSRSYRYSCGDGTCGASDCGDCRTDDDDDDDDDVTCSDRIGANASALDAANASRIMRDCAISVKGSRARTVKGVEVYMVANHMHAVEQERPLGYGLG